MLQTRTGVCFPHTPRPNHHDMLLNCCAFLFSRIGINLALFIDVDDEDLSKEPGEFFSLFPSGLKGSICIFLAVDFSHTMNTIMLADWRKHM